MGISPFGLIGAARVFQPNIDDIDTASCTYRVFDVFCADNKRQLMLNEYNDGARIANNSWGERLVVGANDGLYSGSSQDYVIGVRDAHETGVTGTNGTPLPFPQNQELIVVFANGNSGSHEDV